MGEEQLRRTDQMFCLCTAVYLQRSWTGLGTQSQKDQHIFFCVSKGRVLEAALTLGFHISYLSMHCCAPVPSVMLTAKSGIHHEKNQYLHN